MMLAFEKRLPEVWIRDVPTREQERMHLGSLYGRTLGLVGVGGIGAAVAERARPFGMRMRALRRRSSRAGPAGVEVLDSITDLVASSDHVVIAAPATPDTRGLFDDAVFDAMKPGAHLVNVARGAIVDADALRRALDAGRVAAASLDAVEPEPLPAGHWLYGYPRVRLSPHVSWNMPGAAELLLDAFIDNLRRWRDGRALAGVVDPTAGY
jgi:phosphoglycerate dehydrogenase-like enzyme